MITAIVDMWSIINVIFFVTLGYAWASLREETYNTKSTMGRKNHFKHQMKRLSFNADYYWIKAPRFLRFTIENMNKEFNEIIRNNVDNLRMH